MTVQRTSWSSSIVAKNVADVVSSLPKQIGAVSVQVRVTDKFRSAIGHEPIPTRLTGPRTPRNKRRPFSWEPPVAGAKTWPMVLCGGTIGSLVAIGSAQYVLSNYHVFEADIVPGGNGIVAMTGDPIIQPGLIDVGCNVAGAQTVATLVKKSSLPGSNVDCSIGQVVPGMVDNRGRILEVGTISKTPLAAAINQRVKKSGRTTGLTASRVAGLNGTISVTYENECAGGTAFTKTFTGQILVTSSISNPFISGGTRARSWLRTREGTLVPSVCFMRAARRCDRAADPGSARLSRRDDGRQVGQSGQNMRSHPLAFMRRVVCFSPREIGVG